MLKVVLIALKEIATALFLKIGWKIIVERFASRVVVWGLEKLRDGTENKVVQETVDDVLFQLTGKDLKVIDKCNYQSKAT